MYRPAGLARQKATSLAILWLSLPARITGAAILTGLRNPVLSIVVKIVLGFFIFGVLLVWSFTVLPLYYQQARGLDALTTGLVLAPQGIGTAVALPIVGRLADRVGPRPLVAAGALITTAGTLPYTLLPTDPNDLRSIGP